MTITLDTGYKVRTNHTSRGSEWILIDPSGAVIASGRGTIDHLL